MWKHSILVAVGGSRDISHPHYLSCSSGKDSWFNQAIARAPSSSDPGRSVHNFILPAIS